MTIILQRRCLNCDKDLSCDKRVTRQKLYCSIQCQRDHAYSEYISRWLAGQETGMKGCPRPSRYIRRWLFEQREACWKCGWSEKHPSDGKCPLEVDHIDGHFENNTKDNLRLLCPNCHSLTPTYRARNKGNGRHQRRDRYHAGKSH